MLKLLEIERTYAGMQKAVFYGFVITCFSLRTNKWFNDEYTDLFLLGSATTSPPRPDPIALSRLAVFYGQTTTPPPRPHCTFETCAISHAPSELFVLFLATTPPPPVWSASEISGFFGIPIGQPCIWNVSRPLKFLKWLNWRFVRGVNSRSMLNVNCVTQWTTSNIHHNGDNNWGKIVSRNIK